MNRCHRGTIAVVLCLGLAACNTAKVTSSPSPSLYANAVADAARPAADLALDARRKPAQVLGFLGIRPGMKVLDLFTGSGYYAELLASIVGPDGLVIAQTNKAYLGFAGDAFTQRFDNNRLANSAILLAENNKLDLEDGAFDAMLLALSFHDLYFVDLKNGWPKIDEGQFLAELFSGLKPGGVIGVIDHHASPGSSSETGGTLHRIDPALVVTAMEQAGFTLDAESDVLRNPDDDLGMNVFDESVRGKTDRFLLRFRKPS